MQRSNRVHFIGIGGIGTSALARWFLSQGWQVSGSDQPPLLYDLTKALKTEGVKITMPYRSINVPKDAKLAIYHSAIPKNNPERKRAEKLGIPTKTYAQALGDIVKHRKTFAVAGAHGKSTTTALLSLVLTKAGFDPTVIIGTKLREFGDSNFRKGESEYLIIEADEYKEAFLNYSPFAAIITNIDREHLDYYKNLAHIKNSFLKFTRNIQAGGILVANKDDKNLFSLKLKIQKIAQQNKIKIYWYSIKNRNSRHSHVFAVLNRVLKIPGEHNLSNAMAVYTLAKALGVKEKVIFNTIASYRGAWRRLEYRGRLKIKDLRLKIDVYDDYAHHPTEIRATLAGIRQKWPKIGLVCVFQPHQAKRLSALFKDFVGAFDSADTLILLPLYAVRGRDKVSQAVDSAKLAESIQKRNQKLINLSTYQLKTITYLPSPRQLPKLLNKLFTNPRSSASNFRIDQRQSAIIVMMGAGDIVKYTDSLIR